MKKAISSVLAFALLFCSFTFTGCGHKGSVTVTDASGNVIATPESLDKEDYMLSSDGCGSYVEIVLSEAVSVLKESLDCNDKDAEKALFKNGYTISTAFKPEIYSAMSKMNNDYGSEALSVGCAVTDYEGNLVAVFSSSEINYAVAPQSPHSAFKPLSVYAPAMEEGIIDWSTQIVDMPYMQIEDEEGNLKDWPANASNTYSGKKTSLYEGVKHSLNTMAVHILHKYGVLNSMNFLTGNFGIDLSYEQSRLAVKGEDEIIGNIALGSLYAGVSPVDMAGYYQIFGNLGKYEKPHTILEIKDSEGESVYKYKSEQKQVISEETAYVMNRLLKGVVETDGTGERAYCEGLEVAGKTGTGSNNEGNWFVGIIPEYSIAVWHAAGNDGNIAAAMFSRIVSYMPESTVSEFQSCPKVLKAVYCAESGLLFSGDCNKMQIGYYVYGREPKECGGH